MRGPAPRLRCLAACSVAAVTVLAAAVPATAARAKVIVATSGCTVTVRDITGDFPLVRRDATSGDIEYQLSLGLPSEDGNVEYASPDTPYWYIRSLEALRREPLSAFADIPSMVRVTAIRAGAVIGRASSVVRPRGCTSAQVRRLGAVVTGATWRPSSRGRRRIYSVRVRCSPRYRIVRLISSPPESRALATGPCNRAIHVARRNTGPFTRRGTVPFPLALHVQAVASRATGADATDTLDCFSLLRAGALKPSHGRLQGFVCNPVGGT